MDDVQIIDLFFARDEHAIKETDKKYGKLISDFLRSEKEIDRNVFLHKYWFFDSVSDIAELYSLSENNVKSMLFRTRNRLRDFLKKEGFEV